MYEFEVEGFAPPTKEGRFALFMFDMEKEVAWMTRHTLTGIVLKKQEAGWVLVVKARKGNLAFVAFFEGRDTVECFRQLWGALHRDRLKWVPDRYNPQI